MLNKIKTIIGEGFWGWFSLSLILLGIILRLVAFGQIPPSLNRDEAALGYNAYAFAEHGVDEWGNKWPFTFVSFGDYKLPGYIYTLAPLIKLFGNQDWVVRLPSLIAGFIIIYLTFSIIKQLSGKTVLALFAAGLVALQPWAIFYSRMGWEAHLGLMWLFAASLMAIKEFNLKRLLLFTIFYILSVLTYNAPLLLSPVLLVAIWFTPQKTVKQKAVYSAVLAVVAGIFFSLLIPLTSQKQAITIFSDPAIAEEQRQLFRSAQNPLEKLWHYRYTHLSKITLTNMARSFSPQFLSLGGGAHPWHSIPNGAHLYWIVYALALASIAYLGLSKKWKQLVPIALLLIGSTLPAAITVDAPHATRSLLTLWIMTVLPIIFWQGTKKARWPIALILLTEAVIFTVNYFSYFPQHMPVSWPQGIEQALDQAPQDKTVTFAPSARYDAGLIEDQPYIYVLFYEAVSPYMYQETVQYYPQDVANLYRVKQFGRFNFVNDRQDIPEGSAIITKEADGKYVYQP